MPVGASRDDRLRSLTLEGTQRQVADEMLEFAYGPTDVLFYRPGQLLHGFEYKWTGEGEPLGWIEGLYAWFHDGSKEEAVHQPAGLPFDGTEVMAVTIRGATYAFEAVKNGVSTQAGALILWPGYEHKLEELKNVLMYAQS